MDLSNFVINDKKESLLFSISKFNQDFVENTHSKPQETLEFKMTKQKESFPCSLGAARTMNDGSTKFRSIQHRI